jgi:hypothetical protein
MRFRVLHCEPSTTFAQPFHEVIVDSYFGMKSNRFLAPVLTGGRGEREVPVLAGGCDSLLCCLI